MAAMRLTPWEEQRLLVFSAAELARRHRAAGMRLNHPEAIALICDAMHEAARGGAAFAEVEAVGRAAVREDELIDGVRALLLNLRDTKIVNSIGISILIEIIEKMMDKGGKIAFCCLTPVIHKTFQIMGLANYAAIFDSEEAATKELDLAATASS